MCRGNAAGPCDLGSLVPVPRNMLYDLSSCSSSPRCPHRTYPAQHQPPRDLSHLLLNFMHPSCLRMGLKHTGFLCIAAKRWEETAIRIFLLL